MLKGNKKKIHFWPQDKMTSVVVVFFNSFQFNFNFSPNVSSRQRQWQVVILERMHKNCKTLTEYLLHMDV